ncbi:MAG: VacJ family lipoprotein [Pseudomonadota bacterium]
MTVVAILVTAMMCACTAPEDRTGFGETDAVEPFNRRMLEGNKRMDTYLVRPAAQTYRTLTPDLIRMLVSNGLSHLALAGDMANHVLQVDVDGALATAGRFTVNTVMGAGVLDPATEMGLPRMPDDFGLTLASYGVPEGSYLVLPLLGPTTVRDAVGFAVDRGFQPTTYLGDFGGSEFVSPGLTALNLVSRRDENFEIIDDVLYDSEDSYITLRAIYLQRRRALVRGDDGEGDLPDIFEDEGNG